MHFYEIRNKKTGEFFTTIAPNFMTACKQEGHKPQHCHCVWKARPENAGKPENY